MLRTTVGLCVLRTTVVLHAPAKADLRRLLGEARDSVDYGSPMTDRPNAKKATSKSVTPMTTQPKTAQPLAPLCTGAVRVGGLIDR